MAQTSTGYAWGSALLVGSILARIVSYSVVTSDYTYFLSKWFDALQTSGLSAFQNPFSDYAPLYLYIIKLLTYLPVPSLYSIKTVSVLADIVVAFLACAILKILVPGRSYSQLFFAFAVVFSIPTFLVNSSFWGQADALYAAAALASLYCILLRKPIYASFWFAISLCFKVQALFFAPILIGFLLREKKLLHLFVVPVVYTVSILPVMWGGGSFWYWFFIYAKQSTEYKWLSVSAQSIFAFFNDAPAQDLLFWVGIAVSGLTALVFFVMAARVPVSKKQCFLFLSLLCVLLLPYLLPRMHERYFYLADCLAVIYVLAYPRYWYLATLVVGTSLISYMPYLSQQVQFLSWAKVDLRVPSAILFVTLVGMVYWYFTRCKLKTEQELPNELHEHHFA
ncbi:hypothetical protein KW798_01080 [Candidatus Parcubacteria bacterium]|nr:hypothetical protein [Candidatus Parcubacteria bacterium]